MKIHAIVRTRFIGLHVWSDAPPEVAFLANPHRHEFHVELACNQHHKDRDVEYLQLKRWLDNYLTTIGDSGNGNERLLAGMSCEMIASQIMHHARNEGYFPRRCSVFEDGENGAELMVSEVFF